MLRWLKQKLAEVETQITHFHDSVKTITQTQTQVEETVCELSNELISTGHVFLL